MCPGSINRSKIKQVCFYYLRIGDFGGRIKEYLDRELILGDRAEVETRVGTVALGIGVSKNQCGISELLKKSWIGAGLGKLDHDLALRRNRQYS